MRKLTKIIVKNFQLHKYLEVDLINGVNTIWGTNGQGKSCFIRAILWVMYNSYRGDWFRRKVNGKYTKQTSVTFIYNDGIEVEKIKSNSVNRYILKQNNSEENWIINLELNLPM